MPHLPRGVPVRSIYLNIDDTLSLKTKHGQLLKVQRFTDTL